MLLYFKKARSGAPSGILEQGGGTQCRKERHSAAFLSPRESPRWCTKKSRNECCGFFVAPFPLGRTRTSRKRSCSSRGDWSLNSVRRTEFLTRPLMVHQSTRCKKLQRVFYCNLSKKVQSGAPREGASLLFFVSKQFDPERKTWLPSSWELYCGPKRSLKGVISGVGSYQIINAQ